MLVTMQPVSVAVPSESNSETRERIVRLAGDVPRIELFARERVAGWDNWGLGVNNAKEF